MAKVPDLFEDLKNCYSENEEYSSSIDHLSLNQKSFYDVNYGSHHEECMDQSVSLSISETSKTSKLTFKESVVIVSTNGKVLKKRRLTLNHSITDDDLEGIANDIEEEIIKPRSAPFSFLSNAKYNFNKTRKHQFILNVALNHQSVIQTNDQHLMTTALQNLDEAVKFDMDAYISSKDDDKDYVTLRISKTRLYVSAQDENQPALLKEMPEIPKTITADETNLLFFWETQGTKSYFRSVAHPDLLIATMQDSLVCLARGPPFITDFQILENQA
ncbi:interleukin-1 alpha [Callithrix jacchus]|uniref:Interleukin-1 n=2 Tax=Callithrix jacchus TaxID=9483 RepID=F6VT34_CALJA|nr:interleukin-1 alpha [Callithrix jacchus]